jgi:hypothetical protein
MDTLEKYRRYVQELLEEYVAQGPSREGVESQLLIDSQRNHYQWMRVGWKDFQRVYHVVIHLDIQDGKVWIQQNKTDSNLTELLVEAGVDRNDIVLGLQPIYKRDSSNLVVA